MPDLQGEPLERPRRVRWERQHEDREAELPEVERQKQRLLEVPPKFLHLLVEHTSQEAERVSHDELPDRVLQDPEPQRGPNEPPEQHLLQEPQLLLELPPPH